MGKPLENKYKPEDPRVATFRITHGQWEKFQEICKGQNRSASDAIVSFIDSVIGGDSIPESKGDFPDIEAMVRQQVSEAIASVESSPVDIRSQVIEAIKGLSPEDFEQLKKCDLAAA